MWDRLEAAFERTGLDYSRQGSYAEGDEYPTGFFTFWGLEAPLSTHYDNEPHTAVWRWAVYYYTNDPATLYSAMDDFIGYAREEGFVIEGLGRDIPSDRPDYIGRMVEIAYVQKIQENRS